MTVISIVRPNAYSIQDGDGTNLYKVIQTGILTHPGYVISTEACPGYLDNNNQQQPSLL